MCLPGVEHNGAEERWTTGPHLQEESSRGREEQQRCSSVRLHTREGAAGLPSQRRAELQSREQREVESWEFCFIYDPMRSWVLCQLDQSLLEAGSMGGVPHIGVKDKMEAPERELDGSLCSHKKPCGQSPF